MASGRASVATVQLLRAATFKDSEVWITMKRVLSVLSAIVFLFTMALPVMASQKTAQPHRSSTAATAKSEKNPHEAMSSTHKATVGHAGNSSHQTKKTQKKG